MLWMNLDSVGWDPGKWLRRKKLVRDIVETKIKFMEFPLWLNGLRTQLAFLRMQGQSLASLGELRIQHYQKLWCMLQVHLESGIAAAVAWAKLQLRFDP